MLQKIKKRLDKKGQAVIELSLVVVMILSLIFSLVDFGFVNYQGIIMSEATRNAARRASFLSNPVEMQKAGEIEGMKLINSVLGKIPGGNASVKCSVTPVSQIATKDKNISITCTAKREYIPIVKQIWGDKKIIERTQTTFKGISNS